MKSIYLLGLLVIAIGSTNLFADQFHYTNLLLGERAQGLGGAFTAVSDDASGVIYNPAGLAFALSNDISGSANAFYKRRVVYKKTIGNDDFIEQSGGTTAPFFGGLQKLDEIYPSLSIAFGIFNLDSELKDQDDLVTGKASLGLTRFHRTANIRATTSGLGGAAAIKLTSGVALGLGVNFITIDELVQEYQDVTYANTAFLTQNFRTHLDASALQINLGTQVAFGSVAFGLCVKTPTILTETYETSLDLSTNRGSDGNPLDEVARVDQTLSIEKPLQTLPTEIRFGTAWFASPRLMMSADLIHFTAASSDYFDRLAVTNFATGVEYYITPSIPVRVGLFSNNDARPAVEDGKLNQPDHIDYLGYSLFFALVQTNSQVAVGAVLQTGEGKAQKIQGPQIQDVEAESVTVAFSATHSF